MEPENGESSSEKTMTATEDYIESEFMLHAKMYAVAVKYGVADLDQTAKSQFRSLGSEAWNPYSFLASIPFIYNLIPESPNGLREVAASCMRDRLRSLLADANAYARWRQTCMEIPEFPLDVLDDFARNSLQGSCSTCGPNESVRQSQVRRLTSIKGGESRTWHHPLYRKC